jgi:hypothetical protein
MGLIELRASIKLSINFIQLQRCRKRNRENHRKMPESGNKIVMNYEAFATTSKSKLAIWFFYWCVSILSFFVESIFPSSSPFDFKSLKRRKKGNRKKCFCFSSPTEAQFYVFVTLFYSPVFSPPDDVIMKSFSTSAFDAFIAIAKVFFLPRTHALHGKLISPAKKTHDTLEKALSLGE